MKLITAIIETPKGNTAKYDYDQKGGYFKLSKTMPAGLVFPFDFGFIPHTKGDDGDPLDIIVISELITFTGCAVDCRIIGAMAAEQKERKGKKIRNDRYIAVPSVSELFKDVHSSEQLPETYMKQLEDFFKNYNKGTGKKFKVLEVLDFKRAYKLLEKQLKK